MASHRGFKQPFGCLFQLFVSTITILNWEAPRRRTKTLSVELQEEDQY